MTTFKRCFFTCSFLVIISIPNLLGQTHNLLKGHWKGAFIRSNAQQQLVVQFYQKDSAMYSLQIMEEWHPQFGEFTIPVMIDSIDTIKMNTGHGKAILTLDSNNLEIIGYIEGSQPAINIHLKKIPPPPPPNYLVDEITIANGDISLGGHLHTPKFSSTKTAIIIVGGRSCYAGSTKYDLYAKVLREYGISVLVYNKRGTGKSTGNCDIATIDDLANDLVACKKYLENHPNGYNQIGVLGSSAGGWVMTKAQESTSFDFMISVVGPATSVKEQQFQSMKYGAEFYKLTKEAKANVEAYTKLMFDAAATPSNYKKFQQLLEKSAAEGWKELLDDTDIPPDAAGIENLWVRRHDFNPQKVLEKYNKPFLAIYGGIDWIVPYKENIDRLEKAFIGSRKSLLKTAVAHKAEHGTEVKGAYVSLAENKSYWHFFRISPQVLIELIQFLKNNEFIE